MAAFYNVFDIALVFVAKLVVKQRLGGMQESRRDTKTILSYLAWLRSTGFLESTIVDERFDRNI